MTCELNIMIEKKKNMFVSYNDIFEKQLISLPWKNTCSFGYAIFIITIFE